MGGTKADKNTSFLPKLCCIFTVKSIVSVSNRESEEVKRWRLGLFVHFPYHIEQASRSCFVAISCEDLNGKMSDEKVFSEDPQSPSDCDEPEADEKMLAESGSEIHSPSGSSDNQMQTAEDAEDMEEGVASCAGSSPEDAEDVDVEEGVEDEDTPMSPDAAKSDQEPDTTQLLERVDTNSESGDSNNSSEPHEENSAKGEEALEEDGDSVLTGSEAVAVREATPASPDAEEFLPYRRENDGDLPHGALDDHEGELDFEEEVNERREETDSVGEVDKAADDELSSAKKEEGELPKDDKKEDDDDGEVEDDDDLEEGEVKESSSGRKMQPKPICRFFNKGQCTWGTSCRFLHPGINDKGNYNMFAPARTISSGNAAALTGHGDWQGNGQRVSPTFLGRGTKRSSTTKPGKRPISLTSGSKRAVVRSTADAMLIPPPHEELPQYESAWERGLRHAKEILKKSSKRKESEPDFEDKRLNLSSGGGNEPIMDYEKENEYLGKSQNPYVRNSDSYCTYGSATFDDGYMDPYDRQAHEYWRGGNYENFEVRYTRTEHDYRPRDKFRTPDRERERTRAAPREREREPVYKERERERERSRRDNNKLERVERQRTPERNWREPRYPEVHSSRNRGDEWRDPWRRCDHTLSTTPKRRGGSRSFSSHSSASYSSSRSRRSSSYSSYSGSSSGSSYSSYSSPPRSPSRTKATQKRREAQPPAPVEAKRKAKQIPVKHPVQQTKSSKPASRQAHAAPTPQPPPPPPPPLPPPVIEKKKIVEKQPQPRVASHPGKSENSASKSLKSGNVPPRGRSPTPSESDTESSGTESSHSFSSVSSASSRSSHSSKGYRKEMRMKTLDRKDEKKGRHDFGRKLPREALKRQASDKQKMRLEQSMAAKVKSSVNQTRVEQLYDSASKDPLKQSGHKQQIKLTLLNKPVEKVQTPVVAPLKKESAKKDPVVDKKPKPQPPPLPAPTLPIEPKVVETKSIPVPSGSSSASRKRPLSPSPTLADTTTVSKHHAVSSGTGPKQSPAVSSSTSKKSSTSSRREELLKQLKAIEDAIARKRAKPS